MASPSENDERRFAEAVERLGRGPKKSRDYLWCIVCSKKITGSLLEHHRLEHDLTANEWTQL